MAGLRGPIFDLKTGHLLVVAEVHADERRGVRERDGRDAEVHCADADFELLQSREFGHRSFVERKQDSVLVFRQDSAQSGRSVGIRFRRLGSGTLRESAANLFLEGRDGDRDGLIPRSQPSS